MVSKKVAFALSSTMAGSSKVTEMLFRSMNPGAGVVSGFTFVTVYEALLLFRMFHLSK